MNTSVVEMNCLHLSSTLVQFVVVNTIFLFSTARLVYSSGEFPRRNPAILRPFLSPPSIESGISPASVLACLTVETGTILKAPLASAVIMVLLALSTSTTMTMLLLMVQEVLTGKLFLQ